MPPSGAAADGKRLRLVAIAVGAYRDCRTIAALAGVAKDANRLNDVLYWHRYVPTAAKTIQLYNEQATCDAILGALKQVAG